MCKHGQPCRAQGKGGLFVQRLENSYRSKVPDGLMKWAQCGMSFPKKQWMK